MRTKEVINMALQVIGRGGMSGIKVTADSSNGSLKLILSSAKINQADFPRVSKELRRQQLAEISGSGNKFNVSLTPAGMLRLQQITIDQLQINDQKKWDKRWRVVTFDVPVQFSKQRAAFVQRLQNLGLVMIQKSIWVHPMPCFDQIEQLASHYNVLRYCVMIEVTKFDINTQSKLIRRFKSKLN
jgi:DNA-binding transcriptional regulator PaaX